MQVFTRTDWGAVPPKWVTPMSRSEGMFLHYNGPSVPADVLAGDRQAVFRWLRVIQGYHMNAQGWPDVAYSFCVTATGDIVELRGWGVVGAHTVGWNDKAHAIVFPVGDAQPITDAQVRAANAVIAEHNRRYGAGFVRGHQEAPNSTSCPGGPVMNAIRAGRFRPDPAPVPPVPVPPGVDPAVNKQVMMKIGRHVWLFYGDTPWRVRVQTPADVQTFRFFGVPYQEPDAKTGDFFIRHTQAVKTG